MVRERRKWTETEDNMLKKAVAQAGSSSPMDWHSIATNVPDRTNKDCRKRWHYKLASSVNKGVWTAAEDEQLRKAVKIHGTKWAQVAIDIETRNGDQCSKRWNDAINPDIDHSAWTPQEDELLLQSVERFGRNWKTIVDHHFNGRTALASKNRYSLILRKMGGRRSRPALEKSAVKASSADEEVKERPPAPEEVQVSPRTEPSESDEDMDDLDGEGSSGDDDETSNFIHRGIDQATIARHQHFLSEPTPEEVENPNLGLHPWEERPDQANEFGLPSCDVGDEPLGLLPQLDEDHFMFGFDTHPDTCTAMDTLDLTKTSAYPLVFSPSDANNQPSSISTDFSSPASGDTTATGLTTLPSSDDIMQLGGLRDFSFYDHLTALQVEPSTLQDCHDTAFSLPSPPALSAPQFSVGSEDSIADEHSYPFTSSTGMTPSTSTNNLDIRGPSGTKSGDRDGDTRRQVTITTFCTRERLGRLVQSVMEATNSVVGSDGDASVQLSVR
ncbi:MAG: hypothetical protein M1817_001705 [Caeruleum heppii]|nr:MAG: hypothetical protein M1817_001705 [Caeruleum heppii]